MGRWKFNRNPSIVRHSSKDKPTSLVAPGLIQIGVLGNLRKVWDTELTSPNRSRTRLVQSTTRGSHRRGVGRNDLKDNFVHENKTFSCRNRTCPLGSLPLSDRAERQMWVSQPHCGSSATAAEVLQTRASSFSLLD